MTQNDTLNPSPSKYMALPVVVAVSLVVQALASMSAILPSAIAPELAEALGVPGSLIGFQVSCVYIGAMATSLVGGVFVRRFGALRCFQMALFFVAIGGAMSAIPLFLAVGVGGGIVGLGYGLTNPPSSHLLMKVTTPMNRNLVFSIKQTGVPLGGVIAGLIGPWVALQFGWQMVLVSGAFVSLTLMIFISICARGMVFFYVKGVVQSTQKCSSNCPQFFSSLCFRITGKIVLPPHFPPPPT